MPMTHTAGDQFDALCKLARVPPFGADRLPNWLREYTGELAVRYTVPQADVALACLAAAGTAGRKRARLEVGWGRRPVASNLLVVFSMAESANLLAAVQHVVAPVVARQNELLRRREEFNAIELDKKLQVQRQRPRMALLGEEMPLELKKISDLLRIAKPALLIGGLDRQALLTALSQSVEGTLFLCNEMAGPDGACSTGGNPAMDLDLVQRCLDGYPVVASLRRAKVDMGEPALGGVLIATPPGFASWFTQCGASPSLGASLLLLRSPARAAAVNNASLERFARQEEWRQWMDFLMDGGDSAAAPPDKSKDSEVIALHLSTAARAILFNYRNELFSLKSRLPPSAQDLVAGSYHLAIRILVGLQLLNRLSFHVDDETAASAVALARHYGARQLCAWVDARADMAKGHDAKSKLVRLEAA